MKQTRDEPAARLRRIPPEVFIFVFYFAVACFLTWPMIIRFNSSFYGIAGDNAGAIWQMWWMKNAGRFGGSATFSPLIGYPFGNRLVWPSAEFIADLSDRFLLLFFNEIVVCNIKTLAGFFLPGVTMYYLVRSLTRDRRAAFFGGFAYMIGLFHAFNTLMIMRMATVQWMPLYALALVLFTRKPSRRNAVLLTLSFVLVIGTNQHFGFFMVIFTAGFLAALLVNRYFSMRADAPGDDALGGTLQINTKTMLAALVIIFTTLVIVMPFFSHQIASTNPAGRWPTTPNPGQVRQVGTYYAGAARLVFYVRPCSMNPLIGTLFKSYDFWGESNFLGWSLIALALIGLLFAERRPGNRKSEISQQELERDGGETAVPVGPYLRAQSRKYIYAFFGGGLAALLCSLRPTVELLGIKIYTPSYLFRFIVPWFRWYMRLSIVVYMSVVVLACFGISFLMKRLRRIKWEFIVAVFLVLVTVEMIIVPPFASFDLSETPEVFKQVEKLPPDTGLVIYPTFQQGAFNNSLYMLYQRDFQKPMLNGAADNSDGEALRRTVYNPYCECTPGILSRFGIDKVLFFGKMFSDYEGYATVPELIRRLPGGYRVESHVEKANPEILEDAYILAVDAEPAPLVPIYQGEISPPVIDSGLITIRQLAASGALELLNFTGRPLRASVTLPVMNVGPPHRMTFMAGGSVIEEYELEGKDWKTLEIKDLDVPARGLRLEMIVRGPLVNLCLEEVNLFGFEKTSVAIGDATVTVNE